MIKKITRFLVLVLLACALTLSVSAQAEGYSWYCKHARDHIRPSLAPEFTFIKELDGYFMDQREEEKVVYLTFDAGYENGNVAKILDVLAKEKTPAAFFILGNLISHDEALVRRMADEGHTVCNHTYRHRDMSRMDEAAFLSELRELESLYEAKIGKKLASYYRPPEGRFSRENLSCAKANGYKTVFWSFAYPDWDNDKQMRADQARKIILDNVHNGEVMLLHPTSAVNASILGDVIVTLKSEGYRFGTLDELTEKR